MFRSSQRCWRTHIDEDENISCDGKRASGTLDCASLCMPVGSDRTQNDVGSEWGGGQAAGVQDLIRCEAQSGGTCEVVDGRLHEYAKASDSYFGY